LHLKSDLLASNLLLFTNTTCTATQRRPRRHADAPRRPPPLGGRREAARLPQRQSRGGAVQVEFSRSLKTPGFKPLSLSSDENPVSNFAFKFNLYRYAAEAKFVAAQDALLREDLHGGALQVESS
jgi:hypothetical protein